jgi:hypothetical protein
LGDWDFRSRLLNIYVRGGRLLQWSWMRRRVVVEMEVDVVGVGAGVGVEEEESRHSPRSCAYLLVDRREVEGGVLAAWLISLLSPPLPSSSPPTTARRRPSPAPACAAAATFPCACAPATTFPRPYAVTTDWGYHSFPSSPPAKVPWFRLWFKASVQPKFLNC